MKRLLGASGIAAAIAVALGSPRAAAETASPSDTALGAEDLERLASRLRAGDVDTRRAAVQTLLDAEKESVSALRARLFREYGPSHFRLFNAMRDARPRRREGDDPSDLLEDLLVARRDGDREALDVDLEIVALLRALGRTRTTAGVDALVDFSLREEGIFQREIARTLRSMGDHAIPGLVLARQHEDRPTRVWCARLLEEMDRASPSVAVQQTDNELLAEILSAYATVHDPDAMRVIVSFTGSDRAAVRDAARRAVPEYGQNALWALRSAFENHTGEEPNTAWSWERTARELFERYDRARLAEPAKLLDAGLAHAKRGDSERMMASFRQALALAPSLGRRTEMVEPLEAHADALMEDGREQEALHVVRLALRLDPAGPRAARLRARDLYLQGRRALAVGVPDESLFAEAVRLDPDLDLAEEHLDRLRAERRRGSLRTLQAGLAALAGAVGICAIAGWAWQRRRAARA